MPFFNYIYRKPLIGHYSIVIVYIQFAEHGYTIVVFVFE